MANPVPGPDPGPRCSMPSLVIQSRSARSIAKTSGSSAIRQARTAGPDPKNIVTLFSEGLNGRVREVLIRQKSHQAGIG